MSSDGEETEASYLSEGTGKVKQSAEDILLWDATEQGDVRGVQQAIRNGADVNCLINDSCDYYGTITPLFEA